jgi:hypothetical protein
MLFKTDAEASTAAIADGDSKSEQDGGIAQHHCQHRGTLRSERHADADFTMPFYAGS